MSARLLLLAAACALAASQAGAEAIIGARYEAPVERHGHFALGRPHEYARLSATTDAGRTRLVVPDASWLSLRVIELRGAKLAIKSALMNCGTAVR